MRKLFVLCACLAPLFQASAQQIGRIDMGIKKFEDEKVPPRKENLRDFQGKTTKIVVAGDNSMADLLFSDAVEKGWYISPYEFCDYEEFARIRTDTNYYFLMRVEKSPGRNSASRMEFLSLLKGSPDAVSGIDEMPEIISLPAYPGDDRSGRVFAYFPAYINIIQAHVLKVVENNLYAYAGISAYANATDELDGKTLLLLEDDFAFDIDRRDVASKFGGHAVLTVQDSIDMAIRASAQDTVVSLIVAPMHPHRGDLCYKMLIGTDTYRLYMFRKHRIGANRPAGFLKRDYRKMYRSYGK